MLDAAQFHIWNFESSSKSRHHSYRSANFGWDNSRSIKKKKKKKNHTHTQTKHELFSKSILGYLCNTFCTHDLSFTQIKHKHAHTSAQTLSKHVISINFFDLQIYIHHLNKTSLIVISQSYININFCEWDKQKVVLHTVESLPVVGHAPPYFIWSSLNFTRSFCSSASK